MQLKREIQSLINRGNLEEFHAGAGGNRDVGRDEQSRQDENMKGGRSVIRTIMDELPSTS